MQFIYCNTNLKHTGNNNLNVVTCVLQSQRQKPSFFLARFESEVENRLLIIFDSNSPSTFIFIQQKQRPVSCLSKGTRCRNF